MAGSPEYSDHEFFLQLRKEEVLDTSPLLSLFVDAQDHDELWVSCMEEKILEYRKLFTESFGNNWSDLTTTPLQILLSESALFSGFPTQQDRENHERFYIEQLLMMGYEIGPEKKLLNLYIPDIAEVTDSFAIRNRRTSLATITSFVKIGLYTGGELRNKIETANEIEVPSNSEKLDVYRDFINTLDLGSL